MSDGLPLDGDVAPGFEPVRDQLLEHFANGEELGVQIAATLGGETVIDIAAGFADRDGTQAMTRAHLIPVHSCTKPFAALVIAWLADQGRLGYDQPVASLWPDFAANGKAGVTVAQALSHQAGLPGFTRDWSGADWFDAGKTARRIAAMTPLWEPGTAHGYHPITWGVLAGEIARRADGSAEGRTADGRTLGTILHEELAAPAGADFWIGLPKSEHQRVAEMRLPRALPDFGEINAATRAAFLETWSSPKAPSPDVARSAELPAANGCGSALGMARLAEAYARGGRVGTRRLIGAAVIDDAMRERASGPDLVLPADVSWGIGLLRNRPGRTLYGPGARTVGHTGHGGSCVLADPERELTFAYAMNQQSNALVIDPRAERLIAALYRSL